MSNANTSSSALTLGLAVTAVTLAWASTVGAVVSLYMQKSAPASSPSATASRAREASIMNKSDAKVMDKQHLVDVHIAEIRPLLPPACLLEEIPRTVRIARTVNKGRQSVANVLRRVDDRLVVVVGPCSIHDVQAAKEYANKLKPLCESLEKDLVIIMRVYFEKPRTTVGWKGLINDPDIDGSFNINKGLRLARELLADINEMGLPTGCEFLDTISPQFFCDLVSWGAIGARTTECQLHRELTSGLSMPIGFKNGTGGSLQLAVDAVVSAAHPHSFLGVSSHGLAAIVNTNGNDACHVILRGGSTGTNYSKEHVDKVAALLKKAHQSENVMVDCSHGNSNKDHKNQAIVCADVAAQVAAGDERIMGVMLESNLVEGAQKLVPNMPLEYGKSITDACIGWDDTVVVLHQLAEAVRSRRSVKNRADVMPTRDHADAIVATKMLSGGLTNHVWRVSFASGQTLVLKYFPGAPKGNENLKLPAQRAEVEFCALGSMEAYALPHPLWSTPKPLFYDAEASVVLMSDAGSSLTTLFDLLRQDHGEPPALHLVATGVADFLACVRDITDPKAPTESLSPVLASMHEAARPSLVAALGPELGADWYERSLAARQIDAGWIFGDLWPSSVLVDTATQHVSIVDWEACRPGHVGLDVAQMAANLHLMTLGAPFHNTVAAKCLDELVVALHASRAYDPSFDYAGAFVGHVAMLVIYPHWELPQGPDAAISQAAANAERLFSNVSDHPRQ
ncbi:phospho-2-dehydro-3-deoxyheptonate aldolase [Achlya hypogyna]|uniref:3-deoxy-7-phosphoheptulonate synthase n=1 Tax=Achlya hypogyna TaxID=1202772 RepID=A0A1V9YHD4_ACHHY|nr:phospho-2-dehydro-3-deoxyheptonate aldolase [Achlya hypogyna]